MALSPALGAYAIKAVNAAASFGCTVLLARMAGAATVGQYALAVATAVLLAVVAVRGLDQIMLRQVAGDLASENSAAARGVVRLVLRTVAIGALVLSVVFAGLVALGPAADWLAAAPTVLLVASLGIATHAGLRMVIALLRGQGRPLAGQAVEGLGSVLLIAAFAALWLAGRAPTAAEAVALFFGCQLVTVLAGTAIAARGARQWQPATPPEAAPLLAAGLPIMAMMAIQLFADWLLMALIGQAADAAEVGAFRVAVQILTVITTIVITGESYVLPRFAADFRAQRPDLAWARHRRATLLMVALAGPVVAVALLAPGWLLGLAFGPAFVVAAPALAAMAAGQAVNIIAGPIGGFLTMAGRERALLGCGVLALAVLVALSVVLIPTLGLLGAGIAHGASVAVRNIAAWLLARRLFGSGLPSDAAGGK